ncbi:MAG: hypothetical protein WBM24_15450 [Candidatus Sulfotelmatobacter sp.]
MTDPTTLAQVNISTGAITPDSNGDGLKAGNHFNWYNPNLSGGNCSISCSTDPTLEWFTPNPSPVPPNGTLKAMAELPSTGLGWTYADSCNRVVSNPHVPVSSSKPVKK